MADILRITAGLGDSETRRLLGARDWHASPLGAPESWPPELATAVSMALSSTFPMFLAWGPEQVFLYNDAYIPVLGDKHPAAFGAAFQEVWWEIWHDLGPIAARALANESSSSRTCRSPWSARAIRNRLISPFRTRRCTTARAG